MVLKNIGDIELRRIRLVHRFCFESEKKSVYSGKRGCCGLVYAIEGDAEFIFCDGSRTHLSRGDMMFVSPNAIYSVLCENSFLHYTVNFDAAAAVISEIFGEKLYFAFKDSGSKRYLELFTELCEIWLRKRNAYQLRAMSLLYEVFYELASNSLESAPHDDMLLAAKEVIDSGWWQDIKLPQLAKKARMSETNFRRKWKKQYGCTVMEYRDALRLAHAKDLLGSSYYSVRETAEKCGFSDVSYFIRFFRKKTGISPGAYKG